jgi:hypothetical protein
VLDVELSDRRLTSLVRTDIDDHARMRCFRTRKHASHARSRTPYRKACFRVRKHRIRRRWRCGNLLTIVCHGDKTPETKRIGSPVSIRPISFSPERQLAGQGIRTTVGQARLSALEPSARSLSVRHGEPCCSGRAWPQHRTTRRRCKIGNRQQADYY